jgi:hypothetical protein
MTYCCPVFKPGDLRNDFDALPSGDTTLPASLSDAIRPVIDMPFDDVIAEGPHAAGKHIIDATKRATWPWIASTMRLEQNFKDLELFAGLADEQKLWNDWSMVVNTKRKKPLRKPVSEVFRKIYVLDEMPQFSNSHVLCDVEVDGGSAEPSVRPAGRQEVPDNASLLDLLATNDERKMLAEYVSHSIEVFSYVTVPAPIHSDSDVRCFQLLKQKGHNVLVHTFDADVAKHSDNWLVQPYDIWRGAEIELGKDMPTL